MQTYYYTEPVTGFKLHTVLSIYTLGRKSLYLNHFAQFKLLLNWLGPIAFPKFVASNPRIQWYQQNYEVARLAQVLGCSYEMIYYALAELELKKP